MAMEDDEIIQLYFDRDEQAIAETSEKYGKYCSCIANNILKNSEDADECVNDTYLRAWNVIPPQKPVVFKAFLGRITRNLSFDLYRKTNAQKRGSGQMDVVLEELEECLSGKNDPVEKYERKELLQAINDFLGKLPQEKRILFVSRYWYSDSVTDIAKRCGISENSVSVSLNRLRKRLHDYLLERGILL